MKKRKSSRTPRAPHRQRIPWILSDLLTPLPGMKVEATQSGIECRLGEDVTWEIGWPELLRVAWVTEDPAVAGLDDRFLALQADDTVYLVADGVSGMPKLEKELERMLNPTYGIQGTLENVVADASVVIWPSYDAGKEFWHLAAKDFGSDSVPVHYVTSSR